MDERGGVEEIWCLGDIVGYGPDPGACLALVQERCRYVVAGNHDRAATGQMDISTFNPSAAEAIQWTSGQLNEKELTYLKGLELKIKAGDFTLVHGSPREPVWEYLLSTQAAYENFTSFATPFCLVGHSHIPLIFEEAREGIKLTYPFPPIITMDKDRLIINPGSVGQPRDGDWRASYIIYDNNAKKIELHRLEYNVASTQDKMRKAGLPLSLIERLLYGR